MRISDLHTHPSFKPYHNQREKQSSFQNIWNGVIGKRSFFFKLKKSTRKAINETARDSQSNLNQFIAGDVHTAAFVIHPIERGWFIVPPQHERRIRKLILRIFGLPKKDIRYLAASLTGIPLERAERYLESAENNTPTDYYQSETYQEYSFLKDQQKQRGSWKFNFQIVNGHAAYRQAIEEKTIPVFLSLEGGHSLTEISDGKMFRKEYAELSAGELNGLEESLQRNISRVKGAHDTASFESSHTPIYVTLCHMYQNFLAGHARTYLQGKFISPGMEDLLDQSAGLNNGITSLGRKAIDLLTSDANGRRILIDVKHMSVKARNEYYKIAKERNLPVIASHVAMSGINDFPEIPADRREDHVKYYFSRWSINLSDRDVREIYASDGLIGIALHEGRMPGGKANKKFAAIKNKIKKGEFYDDVLHKAYIKLVMSNIFQLVQAVGEPDAWRIIMIGSDYDGIMNPFDVYPKSSYFKRFIIDLKEFLDEPFPVIIYKNDQEDLLSVDEIKHLMFGISSREIAHMIAIDNFEQFIKKYFP